MIKEFFDIIKNDRFFHPFPFNEDTIIKIFNAKKDKYHFIYFDRKVVGMYMLRGWDEGYEVPSFGMIVHPNYRGLGIGKFMLKSALAEAKLLKCKMVRLTVNNDNEVAKEIYKKVGFKFRDNVGFKKL